MTLRRRVTPVLLALASNALAQSPEGSIPAEPSQEQAPAEGAPGQLSADGVYTVKQGDTLWDLSQQFLNNPWYWPKIWADNPGVENPHWIYPGGRLRIRTPGEGLPGEVSVAEDGGYDEALPQKRGELADFSTGTVDRADSLGQDGDLVSISGGGRIGLRPPSSMRLRVAAIVTGRELADSGTVVGSFEQKELLTTYDRVYVRFQNLGQVKVGDVFSVFRPTAPVSHPLTRQPVGYQSEIIGSLTVVSKEGGVAVAELGKVTGYVQRGDRIGPNAALEKTVRATPNTRDVAGVILTTELPDQVAIGESHVVFIDKGSKDGVAEGNTFTVFHSGDGLAKVLAADTSTTAASPGASEALRKDLPLEPVAQLLVFDVREGSSAAVVTKSLREVAVGDRVEMRSLALLPGAGGD